MLVKPHNTTSAPGWYIFSKCWGLLRSPQKTVPVNWYSSGSALSAVIKSFKYGSSCFRDVSVRLQSLSPKLTTRFMTCIVYSRMVAT